MNRKGAITRRNYQVLRDDASPRGVNSISCNSGEAHTALRGWRPISAVLLVPVPSFYVPGSEDFPNHHRGQRPQCNRRSIGDIACVVNSIPGKNIFEKRCESGNLVQLVVPRGGRASRPRVFAAYSAREILVPYHIDSKMLSLGHEGKDRAIGRHQCFRVAHHYLPSCFTDPPKASKLASVKSKWEHQ